MDARADAAVAWDTQRDGSPDLWFRCSHASAWSDNDNPGSASGKDAQTHPSLVVGPHGHLFLVYLDREAGVMRIRFFSGLPTPGTCYA